MLPTVTYTEGSNENRLFQIIRLFSNSTELTATVDKKEQPGSYRDPAELLLCKLLLCVQSLYVFTFYLVRIFWAFRVANARNFITYKHCRARHYLYPCEGKAS